MTLLIEPMKKLLTIMILLFGALSISAQSGKVQNKPYMDLRAFHFGVMVGFHMQDIELMNVGPHVVVGDDGVGVEKVITCDQDRWDPGFTVGVLGEFRLNNNFALRVAPGMYFGTRHLKFMNFTDLEQEEPITQVQDLKSVYISADVNLIFNAPRLNNTRPYIMVGLDPMMNLSGNDNDYIRLKSYDVFFEIGLGCGFYLPFFKLRPELKFSYSLINSLDTKHQEQIQDVTMKAYATSVSKAHSKMLTLTFFFE